MRAYRYLTALSLLLAGLTLACSSPKTESDSSATIPTVTLQEVSRSMIFDSHELKKVWNAYVDLSKDQGRTWKRTPYFEIDRTLIPEGGIIQPTAWESAPGKFHPLLRSSAGKIARKDSNEEGKTCAQRYLTDLPNNNSAIEVPPPGGEKVALLYNPVEGNRGDRNIIELAVSLDNGMTWPVRHRVEESQDPDGEFSYPSLILDGDQRVYTYTWNRKKVAFGEVKIEELN